MFKSECLVCRDYKRVQNESRACELAYQNLSRITRRFNIPKDLRILDSREYRRYFLGLDLDKPSKRLLCGRACTKVSPQTSERYFKLLKDEHKKIVYLLLNSNDETDFNNLKRQSLSLLRGIHLPHFYKTIESIRFEGRNK